jgi:very-long-chain (3R)-3-hydroxyacyl-CoA dehydratase
MIHHICIHCRPAMFVYVRRYTFFVVLYPVGVTGELLCLYAAQAYVAHKKLWSLEMPNTLNLTFSYHYLLLFIMFLYIPCKFHTSVIR